MAANLDDVMGDYDKFVKRMFGGTTASTPPAAAADIAIPPSSTGPAGPTLAETNRAARVARFGEDAVARMEAAGAKTADYFRGPSLNAPASPGTPAPVAPSVPGATSGGGFTGGARRIASVLGRTAGGGAGIVGAALSAEDMIRNGIGVGNALGLGASSLGTAAMFAPAAAPAAVGAAALGAGEIAGRTLMPDDVATALASFFGRIGKSVGLGGRYAGAGAERLPPVAGPETVKFIQRGGYTPSADLAASLNLPSTPVTIDGQTGRVMEPPAATAPVPAAGAPLPSPFVPAAAGAVAPETVPAEAGSAIGPNAFGVPQNAVPLRTVRTVTGPDGRPVYTNYGPATEARGFGARPPGGATTQRAVNPQTGLPYSYQLLPNTNMTLADFFTALPQYLHARGTEGALMKQENAERAVRVATIKEEGAARRELMKEALKPVILTDSSGNQRSINYAMGTETLVDSKSGKTVTRRITAGAPAYNETNVRGVIAQMRTQNPAATNDQIRRGLKQYYPNEDIPSAWLMAAK